MYLTMLNFEVLFNPIKRYICTQRKITSQHLKVLFSKGVFITFCKCFNMKQFTLFSIWYFALKIFSVIFAC